MIDNPPLSYDSVMPEDLDSFHMACGFPQGIDIPVVKGNDGQDLLQAAYTSHDLQREANYFLKESVLLKQRMLDQMEQQTELLRAHLASTPKIPIYNGTQFMGGSLEPPTQLEIDMDHEHSKDNHDIIHDDIDKARNDKLIDDALDGAFDELYSSEVQTSAQEARKAIEEAIEEDEAKENEAMEDEAREDEKGKVVSKAEEVLEKDLTQPNRMFGDLSFSTIIDAMSEMQTSGHLKPTSQKLSIPAKIIAKELQNRLPFKMPASRATESLKLFLTEVYESNFQLLQQNGVHREHPAWKACVSGNKRVEVKLINYKFCD